MQGEMTVIVEGEVESKRGLKVESRMGQITWLYIKGNNELERKN